MIKFGGNFSHNATVKFATLIRASWNVIFVGFKDKNISNSGENSG
jgi:hypothetical protein